MVTWTVISPDMWGHVHADCEADCPCGGPEADCCDNCGEWENDRHKVGTIEAEPDATDDMLVWLLFEGGFLTDHGRKLAEVEDHVGDGREVDVVDKEGRKLFVLSREEA